MSAKIFDGRLVSDFMLRGVSREVRRLKRKGIKPKLVIILVGDSPASISYIRQKEKAAAKTGIFYIQKNLPSRTSTKNLIALISRLNRDQSVHGILVQLPLPSQIASPLVFRAIDPTKDVDGFQAYNLGKMFLSPRPSHSEATSLTRPRGATLQFEHLAPCTPSGIIKLLEYYKLSPAGKSVTIVGRSNIVGKPLAIMLINRDATVTVCHSKTKRLREFTRRADILIAAVGKPKMIHANMVRRGAIVIDVGVTSVNNKLVGDVDFKNVKKKASWITPVPGGVGPMTVACLMENVVRAARRMNE